MSFLLQANSPNFASGFIVLKPFDWRLKRGLSDVVIMDKLRKAWLREVPDADTIVLGASPVPGLGVAGGFKFMVEDRASEKVSGGGLGFRNLQTKTEKLVDDLNKTPSVSKAKTQFRANTPQLFLDIDRSKVFSLGCSLDDVNQTLDMQLGSVYVNSYNAFGRHWQVTVQADDQFRDRESDIGLFAVRNNQNQMVQLGTLTAPRLIGGPISITRYNLYASAAVTGNVQGGYSTGDTIHDVDATAAQKLPLSMRADWTELMFLQVRAGNSGMYIFALAVLFVFLALSALYESWALPAAVILVVPLCLLCSLAGVLVHRAGREHLRADRAGGAGGAGLQECDLDRRIRQAAYAAGPAALCRHAGGLAAAVAADPHDLLRLHLRRLAAGGGHRRGGRNAPLAGRRRLLRHVGRDGLRHLPHAGLLLRHPGPRRDALLVSPRGKAAVSYVIAGSVGAAPVICWRSCVCTALPWGPIVGAVAGLLVIWTIRELGRQIAYAAQRQYPQRRVTSMLARFFVDRPVFSTVISVVIVLAGLVAVFTLPVAQYPDVTPPTVLVTASYPGANADTVRDTVAAPIEEQVSGVEGMMYMSSRCTNDGAYNLRDHVQAGHGLRHGPGARAEPRLACPAGHSRAGAERRHHDQKAVAQHADDREPGLAQGEARRAAALRQPLPQQLRHALRQGRAGPPAGRCRHRLSRRARLQHPRLAQSRQNGRAWASARRT